LAWLAQKLARTNVVATVNTLRYAIVNLFGY